MAPMAAPPKAPQMGLPSAISAMPAPAAAPTSTYIFLNHNSGELLISKMVL
jgi:hypothetical protein